MSAAVEYWIQHELWNHDGDEWVDHYLQLSGQFPRQIGRVCIDGFRAVGGCGRAGHNDGCCLVVKREDGQQAAFMCGYLAF